MRVVILDIAIRPKSILHIAAVLDLAILAIHDQRYAVLDGHVQWEIGLPIDERLERIAEVRERQVRQLPRDLAVRRAQNVVETGCNECVEVPAANGRGLEGRPSHGERIHAVFVFQLMSDEAAVLAAAAGHDDVVVSVRLSVPVAQLDQLSFADIPIHVLVLVFGESARRADSVLIESDARTLVRDRALFAKPHLRGQLVQTDYISFLHVPSSRINGW